MGMPAQQTEWTAEMARALPDDGKRYEVLDGDGTDRNECREARRRSSDVLRLLSF
jgi:hypothetical protein